MKQLLTCALLLWMGLNSFAYSQLMEQSARVRKISYDNHSDIIPISGVRVRVENEERSDEQGFLTIKITSNIDGTYRFNDIKKIGYTLISPTEEELRTRIFALNPHVSQEIVMVSKIELQKEKKRIVSTRKAYLENKIRLMQEQIKSEPDGTGREALQDELDELLSNYDKILSYIDREAERLSRIDCMTLSDMELKNLNFKKEGKADELIAYNLSLLPENEEEQAHALIKAIQQGEIQLEKLAQLQTHWGLIYKHVAEGHLLRHRREESATWWKLRTLLAPQCIEYRFDHAQFLATYTSDYKTALSEYKQCLDLLPHEEQNQGFRLKLYEQMGIVYSRMGDYSHALEAYSEALKLLSQISTGHERAKASLYTCIAMSEKMRSNYMRSIHYLLEAQQLFETHLGKDHIETAKCYLMLAYNYAQLQKLAEAQSFFQLAKPIIERTYGRDHLIVAESFECEGILAQISERSQQALAAFNSSKSIRVRILGEQHPSTQQIHQRIDKLKNPLLTP